MKRWDLISISTLCLYTLFCALVSCQDRDISHELNRAENLILTNVDSTRTILNQFTDDDFCNEEEKALWSMLYVWAQYRDYAPVIDLGKLDCAFKHFYNSKDPLRRAQVYYLNAAIKEDQKVGNAAEWKDDMYKACLAVAKTGDHAMASKIYQRYEQKLYHALNYEESIKWGKMAREEARLCGNIKEEITALFNLSISYLGLEDTHIRAEHQIQESEEIPQYTTFPDAFRNAFEGLELAQYYKLTEMEGKIYGNLSLFYGRRYMLDSALYYAQKAKMIDEVEYAAGRRREPVRYLHLSDLFRRMGIVDSALFYAQKDLSNPSRITRRNAAFQMYAINYECLNNYKEALAWKKYHDALSDSINATPASVQTELAEVAIEKTLENEQSEENRRTAIIILCVVAVIAVLFLIQLIRNRVHYRDIQKQQETEINQLLKEKESALKKLEKTQKEMALNAAKMEECAPDTVVLTGSTKEKLEIAIERLLYITSESNYILVYYLDDEGHTKRKMLRQTMSNIEKQVADYPNIIRCHRAFFVGIDHVISASSNDAGGLNLSLAHIDDKIPVSKTYIAEIKSAIARKRD